MKIEKKDTGNVFCFEDVEPGSVFRAKDENIYMKLYTRYGSPTLSYNAVSLETGCLALFCADKAVEILPDAVLTY